MLKQFHCNMLAMFKGKKKNLNVLWQWQRVLGMDLQDYDVVRKYFDCWNPSGLYPACVPLCLQVLAIFLFVSWLLFSHFRCIHSLRTLNVLWNTAIILNHLLSPTMNKQAVKARVTFFVHVCDEVSYLEIDLVTHCSSWLSAQQPQFLSITRQ